MHCGWYRSELPNHGLCQMISTNNTKSCSPWNCRQGEYTSFNEDHHSLHHFHSGHPFSHYPYPSIVVLSVSGTPPQSQAAVLSPFLTSDLPNDKCRLQSSKIFGAAIKSIEVRVNIRMSTVTDTSLNLGWIREPSCLLPSKSPSDPLQELHMTGAAFTLSISSLLMHMTITTMLMQQE